MGLPGDGGREGMPLDVAHRGQTAPEGRRGPGGWGAAFGGFGSVAWQVGLPTIDRPPMATDFNIDGTIAGATAVNTAPGLATAIFPGAFQVPPNNVAAIKSITILANALLLTSNIRWRLRFNGGFVAGWSDLTINPRAAGSVELAFTPDETAIPVPEGARIDMVAQVLDAGTYQISFGLHGWFYATSIAQAAANAWGLGG
jgi:hypothetical protein